MNMMSMPMLLFLLLHLDVVTAVASAKVVSFTKVEQKGSLMCAIDVPNKTISSSSSLKDCSLTCSLGDICFGFNIKDSLACDHVMSPVLASTSRTLSPVITYCLQHQGLSHLWSRDVACTGFNIKDSLTCDHMMSHVLSSTSRILSPVITWCHMYCLQHQWLSRLWSRDVTCTGINIKDSLTCDHVMSHVLSSTSRILSPVMCTTMNRVSSHPSQDALSTRLTGFVRFIYQIECSFVLYVDLFLLPLELFCVMCCMFSILSAWCVR